MDAGVDASNSSSAAAVAAASLGPTTAGLPVLPCCQPGAYDGRTPCAALLPGLAIAMPLMKLHLKQRAAQGLMSAKLLCSIMMQVTQRSQAGF